MDKLARLVKQVVAILPNIEERARLPVVKQTVEALLEGEKLMVELNRAEKARSASASDWLGFEVLK